MRLLFILTVVALTGIALAGCPLLGLGGGSEDDGDDDGEAVSETDDDSGTGDTDSGDTDSGDDGGDADSPDGDTTDDGTGDDTPDGSSGDDSGGDETDPGDGTSDPDDPGEEPDAPDADPPYEAEDRLVHELDHSSFALRYAPAGSFEMGWGEGGLETSDERPVHTVNLDAFWIGECEVTQLVWEDVWGDSWPGWPPEAQYGMGDMYPAYSVNYFHVVAFCNELSIQLGFEPCYYSDPELATPYGKSDAGAIPPRPGIEPLYWDTSKDGFRLPTEAEWEYAARYHSDGTFTPGDHLSGASGDYTDSAACDAIAWYDYNSTSMSHPVGSKAPNDLGCYDMSGNVVEWVWDAPDFYTEAEQTNPTGPEPTEPTLDQRRILRGGCWSDPANSCRVTYRASVTPNVGVVTYGLRLVRSVGPEE
jgi:formylglycine-generating enzyme required for sulfatase activity